LRASGVAILDTEDAGSLERPGSRVVVCDIIMAVGVRVVSSDRAQSAKRVLNAVAVENVLRFTWVHCDYLVNTRGRLVSPLVLGSARRVQCCRR